MSVNILLSYAFHAKTDLEKVRQNLVCGRLMIDSGAFTANSTGKQISLKEYAEFLEHWRGKWDHAVTLDVIGDPIASKRQTKKLHDMGLPVMPVFTRGEKIEEFDAMVRDVGYVCVGGGVGMSAATVEKRFALLQRRAESLGGGIHALGMGSIQALRRVRPYSADASNVSGAFRFGTILFFDGERVRNISVSDHKKIAQYRHHMATHEIDAAKLLREKRMPSGSTGRPELMRSMSLSYASADEYLRRRATVPVPEKIKDTPGTHLYSSIVGGFLLDPAAELDRELHEGYNPRIWQQYGQKHVCHPKRARKVAAL